MRVLGQDFQTRTEEQKAAMGTERGRKRQLRKIDRQVRRGKISRAKGQSMKASMYANEGVLQRGTQADELEMIRQADAGERVLSDNMEAFGKAALRGTAKVIGGVPGAVISAGLSGMDAMNTGEDPGMAFLKSGAKSALNAFGGQLLAKGEQAFLTNRAMKEADRLSLAEMNLDDATTALVDDLAAGGDGSAFTDDIKTMGDRMIRRRERFDIAQAKANAGTTALGELARGLDKTGLFNRIAQGNNIIQNEAGIDPRSAAVVNSGGPAYTLPPSPFTVNTLFNPLPE